jgi:hypothetical protein
MTPKQVSLFQCSSEVCKTCKNLSKVEDRFYCNYFSAFLSPETLREKCDFLECKK